MTAKSWAARRWRLLAQAGGNSQPGSVVKRAGSRHWPPAGQRLRRARPLAQRAGSDGRHVVRRLLPVVRLRLYTARRKTRAVSANTRSSVNTKIHRLIRTGQRENAKRNIPLAFLACWRFETLWVGDQQALAHENPARVGGGQIIQLQNHRHGNAIRNRNAAEGVARPHDMDDRAIGLRSLALGHGSGRARRGRGTRAGIRAAAACR